ncbi:hypothetical protein AOL_s00006g82 [Orbilia oligospora ATCC 24927]|uniref:non-specific serine/threonine protein kinase n=2 Tax=Orbilia oligospora TaxID=2813651 RepID=G1WZN1_ARTOA|nr:hypothetical protein AOL_s00006g82 [Orbilia oligospora ATCC 24927]EGX53624.1 hypothetical protein AOL_s00006g82 [Orbilia oligospora ATCC 24927]
MNSDSETNRSISSESPDVGFRQYRQIDDPSNLSTMPANPKQNEETPEVKNSPKDSDISSVPRDQNPFDSTNREHLKMLLQATSTEHHLRNILSKPEYKYTSAEEKQRIIDESLKKMVNLGVIDSRILDFGGRLFEGHRNAVSAYLGSLVGAISGGSVEAKALEQALQRSGLEPPTGFQAQTPRVGLDAPASQGDEYSAIFGPRWEDLECLGRGGFGSVWSCKNLLDGEVYAIKKIIITEPFLRAARIVDEKAREKAFAELHHEVKVLARLDHPNIVRYYGSWMERMSQDQFERVKTELCPDASELEDYTEDYTEDRAWDLSVSDEVSGENNYEQESEDDDESEGDESEDDESEDEDEDEDSEEQENSQPEYSDGDESGGESSGNGNLEAVSRLSLMGDGNKDTDSRLVQRESGQLALLPAQPSSHVHILSIQMAQYSLSLDDLIRTPRENNSSPKAFDFTYTFHPKTATQIMLRIVDAVEYMHHHSLVHRDLKPANIFLKVEKGPIGEINGSIRVAGCKCSHRGHTCPEGGDCLPGDLCWVTPKIGDFGLTADIKRVLGGDGKPAPQGPVGGGTTLYMPPPWAEEALDDVKDIVTGHKGLHLGDSYALGIMFFELLYGFGTATERNILLQKIRDAARSDDPFPTDFCKNYLTLLGNGLIQKVKSIILRLTCGKHSRLCIPKLKRELENLLPLL